MRHPYQLELEVALGLARDAAALVSRHYATDFAVDWKGHGDPVTVADREANALLVDGLAARFPDDVVCAEEADAHEAAAASSRGERCWFVDPLDGTQEFVHRNGEFCVMVGLAVDGRAAMGVLVAPVWGRAFAGVAEHGAWEILPDGARAPLRVTPARTLSGATLAVSRSHRHPRIDALLARGATGRPCGSVGLKVSLVATGEVTGYVHVGRGPKLWDGCAPEAIARGAGAEVTDARGRPLRYDTAELGLTEGLVVASPDLAAALRAALAETA